MLQKLKNIYHGAQALIAQVYYGFPSRKLVLIGVTGTDGKTTTCALLYEILTASGLKTALISTINAKIGTSVIDTGLHVTTPDPWDVAKLLRRALDNGCTHAVMEVSSHGLDQNRVLGCTFFVGVLTNISHEHLDYHKTMKNYIAAKTKLLQYAKYAVVNQDDSSYKKVMLLLHGKKNIQSYGMENAHVTPKIFPFKTRLHGKYNQYNILAAIAAAKILGLAEKGIRQGIWKVADVPGRYNVINNTRGITVVVDFAHKPNALENVLQTARKENPKGRIIALFGCAGERDVQKRAMMGEISGRLADITVVTAEDPRSENVIDISNQIISGLQKSGAVEMHAKNNNKAIHRYVSLPDRTEAIQFAIRKLAKKGDTVLCLGKGHEQSMCYGKKEYPWDEFAAIQTALAV